MSTGLHREASRGFGFTMEEGGVAVQRMQSRLSEHSNRHRNRTAYTLKRLAKPLTLNEDQGATGTSPFGRLRTRAGSILKSSRNRSSTVNTRASRVSNEEPGSPQGGLSPQHTGSQFAAAGSQFGASAGPHGSSSLGQGAYGTQSQSQQGQHHYNDTDRDHQPGGFI
jgi:phospholipid-translocating ATPase